MASNKLTELDPILSNNLNDVDPLYIVDVSSDKSKKVLLSELSQFINEYIVNNSIARIIPYFLEASASGSSNYDTAYNIVDIDWVGASGTYVLNIPSATDIPYRVIRVTNNATVGANDKVHVTPPLGETIDGAAFYNIQKPYNGIAAWSDGTRWIVIQAKSS